MGDKKLSVFTDFSFNVVENELFSALKNTLQNNTNARRRIMFGTDFWVVIPSGDLLESQKDFFRELNVYTDLMTIKNTRNFLFTKPPIT